MSETQKKPEELDALVAELQKANQDQEGLLNEQGEKIEVLEALIAELQKANQDQEGLLNEQGEKIEVLEAENVALKAAIAKSEATGKTIAIKSKDVVVKVDKKQYKILRKAVHIPGIGQRTAEELAQDSDALAKVLSIEGQNILKEIK